MATSREDRTSHAEEWPALFRVRPPRLLVAVGVFLALAWAVFLAFDIVNLGGLGDRLYRPMWHHLFNNRPVEWAQWFLLALATLAAGYLAGRLHGTRHAGAAAFFLLLGLALGLMLIEEAGDIRHDLSAYVRDHIGHEVLGLPYRVASDAPYFAALAAVPVYAFLRYGRFAWRAPSARPYMIVAVSLYGLAAVGSALRHYQGLYQVIGARIDAWFFGGRFPPRLSMSQDRAHFFVVDGPVEESVELVAAACMLAMVLAFAGDLRARRLDPPTAAEGAAEAAQGSAEAGHGSAEAGHGSAEAGHGSAEAAEASDPAPASPAWSTRRRDG